MLRFKYDKPRRSLNSAFKLQHQMSLIIKCNEWDEESFFAFNSNKKYSHIRTLEAKSLWENHHHHVSMKAAKSSCSIRGRGIWSNWKPLENTRLWGLWELMQEFAHDATLNLYFFWQLPKFCLSLQFKVEFMLELFFILKNSLTRCDISNN